MTMTQNRQTKQRPRWTWIFVALGLLMAIVGVPIGINECYKNNTGYITVWNGADVLSYYGTILSTAIGALIAVLTMAFTISFNRRQIQRDAYLRNEKEKWGKTESTIGTALDLINPQRILTLGMENIVQNNNVNINWAIASIQKYQMDCRLATDQLFTCLSYMDSPKVKPLLDAVNNASQQFFDIAQKEYNAYVKLSVAQIRDSALRTQDNAKRFPNTVSAYDISSAENVLNTTTATCPESVYDEIGACNKEMGNAYETTYRQLLSLKGQTFNTIYTEIQKNADEILRFRRKNHANP